VQRPGRHPDDRELASLAVPAFFTFLAAPLYEITDTAIVGRLGVTQLAALAVAAAGFTTVYFVFTSITTGLAGAIARRRGSGNDRAALEMWVAGAWFAIVIGTVSALGLAVFAGPVTRLFGASGEVAELAGTYLRIAVLGLPALMLTTACVNYLRAGRGHARTPLVIGLVANVVNLLLEILFVWVFEWGLAGSAWSTVLVQWAAMLTILALVLRCARGLDVRFVPRRFDVREAAQIGGWMVVRTGALAGALALMTATAARVSENALAANQIAYQIWLFLALAINGLEVAVNAVIGRHLGARAPETARRVARRGLEFSVLIGTVLAVLVVTLRYPIASLFTGDQVVVELVAGALVIVAIMQPLAGIAFVLDGLLIGSGDVRYLAMMMTSALVMVFVPGSLLVLANEWGLNAIWIVVTVWIGWRVLVGGARYLSGRWIPSAPISSGSMP